MSGSGVQLEGQYRPGMVLTLREQGLDEGCPSLRYPTLTQTGDSGEQEAEPGNPHPSPLPPPGRQVAGQIRKGMQGWQDGHPCPLPG